MNEDQSNEVECPNCYALNDVSELKKYEEIKCHNCSIELEYDGKDLLVDI